MKKTLLCCVVALMALTIQAQMNDKMGGGVEKAVAGLEQQWVAAAKMGNADAVAPLLADGYLETETDGSVNNKAQSLARIKGAKWETNEISNVKVSVYGNTAIATGDWNGKGVGNDGKTIDAHERWTDTWVKMGSGKWQCVASASAPIKM
jgi:ketosteroid isomerase-like protein